MKSDKIRKLVLTAMFIAIGMVLPFLTGQIRQIGNMLLPMHIPVLLCGFICGWQYGLAAGFILPLLRSAVFGMPVFVNAAAMAFELAAYGFFSGFLFSRAKWQCIRSLCRCLIVTMLAGRVVWGIAAAIIFGAAGQSFTFSAFMAGAFINAVPGIILQLAFIPALMLALDKTHLVPFRNHHHREKANEA